MPAGLRLFWMICPICWLIGEGSIFRVNENPSGSPPSSSRAFASSTLRGGYASLSSL
jgi:hypothetical protein